MPTRRFNSKCSHHGILKTNQTSYSFIRSFFAYNRASLPDDKFKIPFTRDSATAKIAQDHIRLFVQKADYGMSAFYLTLWQSLMDQTRFQYFNTNYAGKLAYHMQTEGPEHPFMIEYPGRKQLKGRFWFYTFIGEEAQKGWITYFDRERGWPEEGEAILLDSTGKPFKKKALYERHLRFLEQLHLIERVPGADFGTRYGYNLHEFRDVAKTLLHLEGVKDGLDLDAVDFWMGHLNKDKNEYDTFYENKPKMLEQYRIAEPHLALASAKPGPQIKNVDEVIEQIIHSKPAFEKLLDALETRLGSKLTPK